MANCPVSRRANENVLSVLGRADLSARGSSVACELNSSATVWASNVIDYAPTLATAIVAVLEQVKDVEHEYQHDGRDAREDAARQSIR